MAEFGGEEALDAPEHARAVRALRVQHFQCRIAMREAAKLRSTDEYPAYAHALINAWKTRLRGPPATKSRC